MASPAYVLTIAGVAQRFQLGSLQISETANARNTCAVSVFSLDGTYRPALDGDIVITENGVRIFGGTIDGVAESGVGGLGLVRIITAIKGNDYGGIAERQHVGANVPAGTFRAFLSAMLPYLPGVTLDAAQVVGPALPAMPYSYDKVTRDALNEACVLAGGFVWEIDYGKVLRAFLPGTIACPFNVAPGDGHVIGDVTVEPQRQSGQYANRIIVQAGTGTSRIRQNWIGDGVTTHWITDVPATNDWPGTYHMHGADNPLGPYEPGNTGSLWAVQWDAATHGLYQRAGDPPFANGDPFYLDYVAQYPFSVVVDNLAEQAIHGVWDLAVALPDVFTKPDAVAYGNAYVSTTIVVPKQVTYLTEQLGARPGMMQTINVPKRGINGTYLITSVQTANSRDKAMQRTITAIEGATLRGAAPDNLFKQWSGGGAVAAATVTTAASPGTGGTGGGGSGRSSYFLGGSGLEARRTNVAGDWVPASGGSAIGQGAIQVQLDTVTRGSSTATVTARLRSMAAGVSVIARLYNASDAVACAGVSAAVTSTSWQTVVFSVTLAAGAKFYELQLQPSAAGADVFGVGYVE
jgi:hypothetical protein